MSVDVSIGWLFILLRYKLENYSITFATLNCLEYTKKCINSLIDSGTDPQKIAVVDNASTDGTQDYLQSMNLGHVILNRENLSCGAAWNQGILANQSEWTIVMNNDIIVPDGFAHGLIKFAIDNNLKLVSPARIDGSMDYDYDAFYCDAQVKMSDVVRMGSSNAICMCIHWSLFMHYGFFQANPTLLGFEDGMFYHALRQAKVQHATTGQVWIHHFGSVTQEYMKMVLGIKNENVLVKVNDRKLYNQSWLERKLYRYELKRSHQQWRKKEISEHNMTLHGVRKNNEFIWI
jgi:glycosyltransferase involved in cell wall biosynthesis